MKFCALDHIIFAKWDHSISTHATESANSQKEPDMRDSAITEHTTELRKYDGNQILTLSNSMRCPVASERCGFSPIETGPVETVY